MQKHAKQKFIKNEIPFLLQEKGPDKKKNIIVLFPIAYCLPSVTKNNVVRTKNKGISADVL